MYTSYRSILKESIKISWKNRWLWFFGLFAVALGGGGEFNILQKNILAVQDQSIYLSDIRSVFAQGSIGAWLLTFIEVVRNLNFISVITILLVFIVALFLLWLAVVSQGGLISGAFRRYKGETASFAESWRRGLSKFWNVLWLNISGKVLTYLWLVLLGLPFVYFFLKTQNLAWQWGLLFVSFCIFVPFTIILAFLVKYAVISVVIKNNGFKLAVKESWKLFTKNWVVSVEMAIIFFLIDIVFGLGVLAILIILVSPFAVVGMIFYSMQIVPLLWLVTAIALTILMVGLFTLGAFYSTFKITAWVIFFNHLSEGIVIPRILHFIAWFTGKKRLKK